MIVDDELLTDEKIMAQKFADYFKDIPISTRRSLNEPIDNYDDLVPLNDSSIFLNPSTPHEVSLVLDKLNNKSNKGDIPTKILKTIKNELSPILSKLFNMCPFKILKWTISFIE